MRDSLQRTGEGGGVALLTAVVVNCGVFGSMCVCPCSSGVDFQSYDSPDQAVAAAMKASGSGVVSAEAVVEAPAL